MRQIPVDTAAMTVMLIQEPETKVKNRETGEIATDRTSGKTLYNVNVAVIVDGRPDAVTVVVAEDGLQPDLVPGMAVELPGLVARPWENDFGHGISYRAIAVTAKNLTPAGSNGKG
ncbi:SCO3933 family regulatory protein [Streptomyces sp. NPDC054855]